jgi:cytosine/adenosine deaminase-related metal-dependent hydrolase
MPGFVQAHLHLAQTLHRGAAEDRTLLPWLAQVVWPLEAAHDEETLAAAARLGIAECLDAGVTTILDMGTTHLHEVVLREIWNGGIRALSGKAMMDLDLDKSAPEKLRESTRQSLDESERLATLVEERYAPRVQYAYAPRFALSASTELHREVARRARERERWIHTHASETRAEVAAVVKIVGDTCVRFLQREGVLDGRATVAHAVHLGSGEAEILGRSKTGVAHCPSSNLKLGSGIADVARLRQAQVAVGLGSDGAPCNNRLDPFREMSLAALLPRRDGVLTQVSARDAVRMATIEGARAIGLDAEIGTLQAGKRADVVVLDLRRFHTAASGDPHTALVYSASPANVRDVVCDGRVVKRDYRLTGFDEREVAVKAMEARAKLLRRAGLA